MLKKFKSKLRYRRRIIFVQKYTLQKEYSRLYVILYKKVLPI